MFVIPERRGSGVATAVLRALELLAGDELGWDRLVLETGDRQPDAIGEFPADHRAAERVAPQDVQVHYPFICRYELADATAEQDVFDALNAQGDDGGLNGLRWARAPVERGIGDAQELRADGFFVGDQLRQLVERELRAADGWENFKRASCVMHPKREKSDLLLADTGAGLKTGAYRSWMTP